MSESCRRKSRCVQCRQDLDGLRRPSQLAIAAVNKRLENPTDRVDLLTRLQQGKDDNGEPLGKEELTAEALTQLIAGSDTTSKYVPVNILTAT